MTRNELCRIQKEGLLIRFKNAVTSYDGLNTQSMELIAKMKNKVNVLEEELLHRLDFYDKYHREGSDGYREDDGQKVVEGIQ